MIGLPDGWDDDLYPDEVRPTGAAPFGLQFEGKTSTAAQLLRRASDVPRQPLQEAGVYLKDEPVLDALADDESGADLAKAASRGADAGAPAPAKRPGGAGADAVALAGGAALGGALCSAPPRGAPAAAAWAPAARASGLASFRASARGGLVVQPLGRGGACVRLLRLAPARPGGSAGEGGVGLLEAQLPSLAGPVGAEPCQAARPIVPQAEAAQALLGGRAAGGSGPLEPHAKEALELLGALCGEQEASRGSQAPVEWLPGGERAARGAARGVSTWLTRVNARAVRGHLRREPPNAAACKLVDLGAAGDGALVDSGLRAVCHHLAANSVGRALQELSAIAGRSKAGERSCFDRLAAVVASCGGASARGRERRQWLRQQLMEWRSVGAHKLMGPALWKIYSLLAGDLDDVVDEALDWRAAFGMFVWYDHPVAAADGSSKDGLLKAVCHFEDAVKRSSVACSFRPVPPYSVVRPGPPLKGAWLGAADAAARPEARDLHFNIIRSAVGLADWHDLTNFDYYTHSSCPVDVACSWHVSLLVLALCGGDTASSAFQLLTQQYCFLLELLGHWEWAVYVGLFIRDACARSVAVQGLLQRHAGALASADTRVLERVPRAWVRRAQARACEASRDWLPAVVCWLELGGAERALGLALAFLQGPALAAHLGAALRRGAAEGLSLAPLAPAARWLLAVYEEHSAAAAASEEAWAAACRAALALLRGRAGAAEACEPAALVHLCWRCGWLRRHMLGVPW